MHDIEKQVVVEKILVLTWNCYTNEWCKYGAILASKGVKIPRLEFICKGIDVAGRFYSRHRFYDVPVVEINTAYFDGIYRGNLNVTIAHELAHYIQHAILPRNSFQWHGPEFRDIMQSIGHDGNTYHSMKKRDAVAVAQRSKKQLFEL